MWRANVEEFNNKSSTYSVLDFFGWRENVRVSNAFYPQPFCMAKKRVKNGNHSNSQTFYPIVTKLDTDTQCKVLRGRMESLFQLMSARRRCRSEKITFFAHPEEVPHLIFTKKYSKNQRHPYAQFGVEIMLISLYLAKMWPKNHFKSRDLAKFRYNALLT